MANLIELLIGTFENHLTQSDVKQFIIKELETLNDRKAGGELATTDLEKLRTLLVKLEWTDGSRFQDESAVTYILDLGAAESWMGKLYNDYVITGGVVETGTGNYLDMLDYSDFYQEFVLREADRLLRHVENRRSSSLRQFSNNLDFEQVFNERIAVSTFFSRYAKRHRDLRFINSVFKINEWLMRDYRKTKKDDLRINFLLALAEQEIAAKELMS